MEQIDIDRVLNDSLLRTERTWRILYLNGARLEMLFSDSVGTDATGRRTTVEFSIWIVSGRTQLSTKERSLEPIAYQDNAFHSHPGRRLLISHPTGSSRSRVRLGGPVTNLKGWTGVNRANWDTRVFRENWIS